MEIMLFNVSRENGNFKVHTHEYLENTNRTDTIVNEYHEVVYEVSNLIMRHMYETSFMMMKTYENITAVLNALKELNINVSADIYEEKQIIEIKLLSDEKFPENIQYDVGRTAVSNPIEYLEELRSRIKVNVY